MYRLFFAYVVLSWCACEIPTQNGTSLTHIDYDPVSYTIEAPEGFPPMEIPTDNPMTEDGVNLGRHLFYDPILSRDSSISCSSCHRIEKAFTDGLSKSVGIEGRVGRRNAMSLINIGYSWVQNRPHNFMWDGRMATLEDQALEPIEDPNEMDADWNTIMDRLRNHDLYPTLFRKAFGIENTEEMDKFLAAKAIAQFERILNSASSRYDEDRWTPFVYMNAQELRGFQLFLGDADGSPVTKDGECAHCHSFSSGKALFARNGFSNNGLDSVGALNEFIDLGLGEVTGVEQHNGQFREVTVRNVGLTAPYMHDGRFNTLEEVIDHYTSGGHPAPNLAPEIATAPSLRYFTAQEKEDLVAFLHALTDTSYLSRDDWKSPF